MQARPHVGQGNLGLVFVNGSKSADKFELLMNYRYRVTPYSRSAAAKDLPVPVERIPLGIVLASPDLLAAGH